jgi:hypothetical protein
VRGEGGYLIYCDSIGRYAGKCGVGQKKMGFHPAMDQWYPVYRWHIGNNFPWDISGA